MFRNSFRAAAVVLVTGALAPSVPASAGMDPASFINNLGNQLQTVTGSASAEQRLAGFQELFRTDFDVPGLGRFVLGRFWRAFTPLEQQEFLSLFERYVVLTYSEKLSDYTEDGGCPRVTGSRPEPDGAVVSSLIVRGRTAQPLKIDWRLTLHKTATRLRGPLRLSEFALRRATPGMLRARLLIRLSWRSQCNSLHVGHRPCSS